MGVLYIAVNDAKREFYDPNRENLSSKWSGWVDGRSAGRLAELMLTRWQADAVYLLSDRFDELLAKIEDTYTAVLPDDSIHWTAE